MNQQTKGTVLHVQSLSLTMVSSLSRNRKECGEALRDCAIVGIRIEKLDIIVIFRMQSSELNLQGAMTIRA